MGVVCVQCACARGCFVIAPDRGHSACVAAQLLRSDPCRTDDSPSLFGTCSDSSDRPIVKVAQQNI